MRGVTLGQLASVLDDDELAIFANVHDDLAARECDDCEAARYHALVAEELRRLWAERQVDGLWLMRYRPSPTVPPVR